MLSTGGGTVFTGDDDPELIRDALPFALKLYESLLEQVPDNPKLLLATGKLCCMYAYAFIQTFADELPDNEIETQLKMQKRAKRLYLRGRNYILRGLEVRHPGFNNLLTEKDIEPALNLCTKKDIEYLYWAGMSWMGAFTADKFDMELAVGSAKAVKIISKVLELDETYEDGGVHEFFISYYGSLPAAMGGSEEKARKHFQRAIELSKGLKASPYIALATSVCINNQNAEEFRSLLNKALDIDLDKNPQNRLLNILSQRKAKWLLDNIDNYFLLEKGEKEK